MRPTRFVFQRASDAVKSRPFILPPPSLSTLAMGALQGLWSHFTDQSARDGYEQLVEKGIIQDRVLAKSSYGAVRTMALFHELHQNPLLQEYQLDPQAFCTAILPALERYLDTVGRLVLDTPREEEEELNTGSTPTATSNNKSENLLSIATSDSIPWHQQAREDPSSLAGQLSRMATDHLMREHYLGARLFHMMWTPQQARYVPGSSVVKSVALLQARVEAVWDEEEGVPKEDGNGTDKRDPDVHVDPPIAAQWTVVYEMEQRFQKGGAPMIDSDNTPATRLTKAEQYKNMMGDPVPGTSSPAEDGDSEATENRTKNESMATEKEADESIDKVATTSNDEKQNDESQFVTETSVVVAVLEGWLRGGPDKEFRWKVAQMRDAFEFRS